MVDGRTSAIRKGCLLVAAEELADPNFAHSVILVCEHGPEGTMGLIVNRRLEAAVAEILPQGFSAPPDLGAVHQGGPVQQDHLLFLHGLAKSGLDVHPVCAGVFLGGDPEVLRQVLSEGPAPGFLRCYLGYSGWGPGQLEAEVSGGAWVIRNASAREVFSGDGDLLWKRLLESPARDPFASPGGGELN